MFAVDTSNMHVESYLNIPAKFVSREAGISLIFISKKPLERSARINLEMNTVIMLCVVYNSLVMGQDHLPIDE